MFNNSQLDNLKSEKNELVQLVEWIVFDNKTIISYETQKVDIGSDQT